MNAESITKVAIATVGVTQILKNVIPLKVGKLWTLFTILVGVGITVIQCLCPSVVMDSTIAISGATIFYDTIYQSFEKLFKGGKDA